MRSWFSHPLALHAFWLVPLLAVFTIMARRRRHGALGQLGPLIAVRLAKGRAPWRRTARAACWGLALLALIFAAAGPRWGRGREEGLVSGRDLVVVLDLSRSMLTRDVLPNRAKQAKRSLLDLADTIEQRGGHRLGLVVFAARPRVVCPLTHDYDHFRATVLEQDAAVPHPEIRPTGQDAISGTRLGAALEAAVKLHDERFRGFQDILLLSDGDDPIRDGEWGEGVAAAQNAGIPVHVLGIGDPETASPVPGNGDSPLRHEDKAVQSRMEAELLRGIALRTGGTPILAGTRTVHLGDLFREVIEPAADRETGDDAVTTYQPRQVWFFAAALFLLTSEMLLGYTVKSRRKTMPGSTFISGLAPRAAVVLLLPFLISAAPRDGWQAVLRQAVDAFLRQDFQSCSRLCEAAEERAVDPGLVAFNKAAASYQLGVREEDRTRARELLRDAERHYHFALADATGERRTRALLDRGNALLQMGRDGDRRSLEHAVESLERCLREVRDGELRESARYNLELAKALWLHAQRARSGSSPESDPPEPNPTASDPQRDPGPVPWGKDPKKGMQGTPRPLRMQSGDSSQGTTEASQAAAPGRGQIPPLPDDEELNQLSADEVAAHLRDAVERIERERAAQYQRAASPPSRKVKDW